MYTGLLLLHSLVRWLVLIFILYAIYKAFMGYTRNRLFSASDNAIRHWTATVAHIQLMTGIILYSKSPVVTAYWSGSNTSLPHGDFSFFGIIHITAMFIAITLLTIGSAMVKRKPTDREKFKTMLTWYSVALIVIFMAIPWPFSPLSNRPYLRTF